MPASVALSDGSVVTPGVMPGRVPQMDHSVASQLAAMNIQGGVPQMNGWQNAASCHNQFSMTSCDNQIGAGLQAVMRGPDWSSTAVFITFDDFGGFYDQVPPPATLNASGQQAAPRVPLVIVSPYAKPGYTDTTPASFASILAYTEQNFGLAPLSANDAGAYNFSNAFDYSQAPLRPAQMTKRALPPWARHLKITKAEADDPT
jgi:phospholipase C